jgi:cytochrome c oxidase subunit II
MIMVRRILRRSGRRTAAYVAVAALVATSAFAAEQPDGAAIYAQQCAMCHGTSGEGTAGFPALAGSQVVLGDAREMVRVVLWGRGGMPSFAGQLSDAEIAAVTTHERTSWGNDAEPIEESFVAEVRDEGAARDEGEAREDDEAAREDDEDAAEPAETAETADAPPEDVEVDLPEDWFEQGREHFHTHCVACHQADGSGIPGAFPRLAGNPFVTGPAQNVIHVVLNGRAGMPSFGGVSDEQLALIISYVRQAWENEAHRVDAGMVATVRDGDELDLTPVSPLDRPGAGN